MNSTLSPDFLVAASLQAGFKPNPTLDCRCALLRLALTQETFTGADLSDDLTGGNPTMAGCAVGSLVSWGLIEACGRVKSPKPNANGRKVDVLRLAEGKRGAAIAFLKANQREIPVEHQQELFAS